MKTNGHDVINGNDGEDDSEPKTVRIAIADDQPVFRRGLQSLIAGHKDLSVVGEASAAKAILPTVERLWPDILVTDLEIGGISTLDTIRHIARKHVGTRIFVLATETDVAKIAEALRAGATGYGLKSAADVDFLSGIRFVSAGHRYICRHIDQPALDQYITGPDAASEDYKPLTVREQEVLLLVTQGLTSREIALQLGIGRRTVESHASSLLSKLGVRNKAQLIRVAIVERMVQV